MNTLEPPEKHQSLVRALLPHLDTWDTAALVVHLPRLQARLNHLTDALPAHTQHSIAIKTNPHPSMLAYLVEQDFGLEAASIEEVRRAQQAGCPTEKLVFDSPVKTHAEIEEVAQLPGCLVNVNTLGELERFPSQSNCVIGIRMNPQIQTGSPEIFDVSSNESKFGVPMSDEEEVLKAAQRFSIGALHVHSGSQIKNMDAQRHALQDLVRLAQRINKETTSQIHTLDIGGGLPTEPLQPNSAMAQYGAMLQSIEGLTDFQLVTEFGQWVHTEAGLALSHVEYVIQPNRIFIHLGADFFMRDAYTTPRNFPLSVWTQHAEQRGANKQTFAIAGPLCFAGDYLYHKAELPSNIQEHDWLLIDHTGANTYALWSRHCSRDVPAVFAWTGDSIERWSSRQAISF